MADQILFAGGRLDSLTVVAGTPTEVTTSGFFDTAYADCAVTVPNISSAVAATFRDASFAAADVVTGEVAYAHFVVRHPSATTTPTSVTPCWTLYDSAGYPWLSVCVTATNGVMGLYYNSGTGASPVWTLIGSTFAFTVNTRNTYDIKLTLGSPHVVELSQDNSIIASGTFTQAALTSLRSLRLAGQNSSNAKSYSEILCTRGISTINGHVAYSRATGAGSNSGWTGSAANVNEAVNSDATVDSTTSAGVKQTYAMGDVAVPAGFVIKSVFHWLRAKNDGTTPSNIKSVIRSGGADYSSGNLSGLGTSFGAVGMRYDTDPGTSATWTQSGFNAIEAGYESAA